MTENKKTIKHQDMCLEYIETPMGYWQNAFNADGGHSPVKPVPFPNFQLAAAGHSFGFYPALTTGCTYLPQQMTMEKFENDEKNIVLAYSHRENGLKAVVDMQLIPGINMIRQTTSIINGGDEPVTLTHVSSMQMDGIATNGIRPWHDPEKIRINYCLQTWQNEGQWRQSTLEDLGLTPHSVHPVYASIHFSSVGSWSTSRYLPMMVMEDMETKQVWYFQIEASSNWHFEIGHRGSWDNGDGSLYLHADGADERWGGWTKTLQPGESFESVPVAFGCCRGDFSDAVRKLTKYRRQERKLADFPDTPVVFNDYMNNLWGDPDKEKLIPCIDAAAAAGAEYYCIDAGWQGETGESWGESLGDWIPSATRFGAKGLQGIFDYIRSKGMKPGVWIEFEICAEKAELHKKPDSWFLMRNAKRAGGADRRFLNFTNPEVRGYIHGVIDRLAGMGVEYIKNDYNACIGAGCEIGSLSPADGLIEHSRAVYSFMKELREKHPRIVLENVGSGGMRQDYGTMGEYHIQSITDQEIYKKYPLILTGALAAILPEQLGIWVYPSPLLYHDMRNNPEIFKDGLYRESMSDGEQTIFNMVNGLCGAICLSGMIKEADGKNMSLIQEAVALHKAERSSLRQTYPFWPIGFTRLNQTNAWCSVGLQSEDGGKAYLAVWRLDSVSEYIELPLKGFAGAEADAKLLYPSEGYEVESYYNAQAGKLTVRLPKNNQARFFLITKK